MACIDSLKLCLWIFGWEDAFKTFKIFSMCPNHWFMLPLLAAGISRFFSPLLWLHCAVPVFSKCHHCAQEGICWVHSCKCSLRGTNRLLKTKLRSRNLSACHLYYLFCFVCLHSVCGQRMETARILCISENPVTWNIILSSCVQQI